MPKPLNEQNIIDRVEAETRAENAAPVGSSTTGVPRFTDNRKIVHTASGVANESVGYFGTAGNPGQL